MRQSKSEPCEEATLLGLDQAQRTRLVNLYDLEGYLFNRVSKRFAQQGTLSDYDFYAIVIWKSNRAKTKIKRGLSEAGATVSSLMRELYAAEKPQDKVENLLALWGIGLAMASAILAVCYPEKFTVLDYRAWETLRDNSVVDLPERYPQSSAGYLEYCSACRQLAERVGLSLRNLDRALWAKNWEDDLIELIGE